VKSILCLRKYQIRCGYLLINRIQTECTDLVLFCVVVCWCN